MTVGQDVRNMQEHVLVAFASRRVLNIARTAALDLNSAASLMLDVLHIRSAVSDDLGSQIEAGDRVKGDGDLFLGPFALQCLG